jgi:tetratricopeptide (TPR) repeat protein
MKSDTSATGWEVRLDVCRALHEFGKIEEAKRELDTMLMRDSYHAGVLYNYGAIEANAGDYDEARKHWSLLIEKHPQDSLAQFAERSMKVLDQRPAHP